MPYRFTTQLSRDSSPPCEATVAKAACVAVCAGALLDTALPASASPGQDGTVGLKVLGWLLAPYTAQHGWTPTHLLSLPLASPLGKEHLHFCRVKDVLFGKH